ncbi:MAG: glutamyl-tRNA reductase [Candidatus Omnitrophica bacterium]|nr:glutamyl-tRNA reductase [Candidatus Omnitrophota bacterium]
MHILLVGLSYKSAPVELRERLAFQRGQLEDVFARLRHDVGLEEAAVLSTCNRVEIYGRASQLDGSVARLQQFFSRHGGVEESRLSPALYSCAQPQSVRHLFAVASGLESMVLGEAEIQQQVKLAYEHARLYGATGKVFNALFQRALNAAKAVRTHTGIGRGAVSVGTVAVELAGKIFDPLSRAVVVLVGAGKIGELTLRRLADRGVRDVRVVNRSLERAVDVASIYAARPVAYEQLGEQLLEADIVLTSTGAPGFILTRQQVEAAMRARHHRPLCLVDVGVPRNVEPSAGALENVYRFDIDDLQGVVAHAHQERQQAVAQSRRIIDEKVDRFLAWWRSECQGPSVESPAGESADQPPAGQDSTVETQQPTLR